MGSISSNLVLSCYTYYNYPKIVSKSKGYTVDKTKKYSENSI